VGHKALEIRLLGELAVLRGGVVVELPASKKSRALLAYLVASARPHLRERLCDLLWQGPDDPRAALRWSLTKIRPVLDDPRLQRLVADRERVAFEASGVQIDLVALRSDLSEGLGETSTEVLRAAAGRFRGELMEGLDLPDCYRFHEWCVSERETVRALRVAILSTLADRLSTTPEDALSYARARVAIDPLSEGAHVVVVRLLTELGRKREAQNQIETCERILASELGTKPSPALLQARLRIGTADPARPTRASTAAVLQEVTPMLLPLVGRAKERELLASCAQEAQHGRLRSVVMLVGEAGIGKSRLLDELASAVLRTGGVVLRGRAFEAEMVRPYGPWIDALRSIGTDAIPPELRSDLTPLLPELGAPLDRIGDRNRLFDAVAALLRALGRGASVAVLLDDLQWFDESSVALLHFVTRGLDATPILLACAGRRDELSDNVPVTRLLRALERDRHLHRIDLAALDAQSTAELARSLDPHVDTSRVFAESAGNPLFAVELTRALERGEGGPSESLKELIADRLARLDDRAREILPWAASLGRGFGLDLLSSIARIQPTDMLTGIEELERRGIFRASSTPSGALGYDFVHDLIRAVAYRKLSEPRRRLIHLQIARTLQAMAEHDASIAGDVAHHAALGGDAELAARAYLRAGERCLRIFANAEAVILASAGIRMLEGLPRNVRIPLHVALLRVQVISGTWLRRPTELVEELSRVVLEAQDAGLHADVALGFHTLSTLQHDKGDLRGARESTLRAAKAGREADPRTRARQLADSARCLTLIEREMPQAKQLIDEALSLVEREGMRLLELDWAQGLFQVYIGDPRRGAAFLTSALGLAREQEDRWAQFEALMRLTMIDLEEGRARDALERCRELVPVAAKMGEGSEGPAAHAVEALAMLACGQEGALALVDRALCVLREVDAKGMLAYVLSFAAEIELAAERVDHARARAQEALQASEVVDRRSLVTLSHVVLGRIALREGDASAAARHLASISRDLETPLGLNARARRAALALSDAIDLSKPDLVP
jgi:DNA-binding SARP family transcriptional activator/tetratricopeptide (TPR) repeat protein